jgi:hypothetical protein
MEYADAPMFGTSLLGRFGWVRARLAAEIAGGSKTAGEAARQVGPPMVSQRTSRDSLSQ